jgi:hypothetical protein
LSAKYNITLGGLSIYAHNSTYPNDVAGIGRDNVSNQHLSARGQSIVEITAASLDDSDFLLWGDNGATLSTTIVNNHADYASLGGNRLSREWRVTELGESGDITLIFDVTGNTFGGTDDYELLIDADGDFTDALRISGTFLANKVTFTVTAAQLQNDYYFTLGNTSGRVVISVVDGQDWNTPSTWNCNCIPDDGFGAIIDDGHTVTVSSDQSINNLTVNATGALVVNANVVLAVNGNVDVLGSATFDRLSTLNFLGNTYQTINLSGSNDIGNCEVNNLAGISFSTGTYSFYGVLTPTNGDIDFNNNDVTFVSDATGTAVIGVVGAGASFSGTSDIKVQRFIPAGVAGYRNIGSPLNSFVLREWDDEIYISGTGFPDGCAYSGSGCFHSARYWRPDLQEYRTVNDLDSNILNGFSLEIFLGDNLNTFSATSITSVGVPNISESVDIQVQNGWNLISNPFLSPIDFDNIVRNGTTGNYFYVYDPSISGFQYWDGDGQVSSVSNLDDGILSSSQGFWVFHSGASSTITIDQSSKSVSANDSFLKSNNEFSFQKFMTMELNGQSMSEKALGMLKFIDQEKTVKEGLPNLNLNGLNSMSVYSTDVDGNDWVVNELLNSSDCFELPVFVDVLKGGEYSITFNNIYKGYDVYAMDNATKKVIKIVEGSIIVFDIQDDKIKRSNPITLSFKKKGTCIAESVSDEFDIHVVIDNISISAIEPLDQDVTISVFNTVGAQVTPNVRMNRESSNILLNINGLSGMFLVSITDLNGQVLKVEKVFLAK